MHVKSLAAQVDELSNQYSDLQYLAGEILATVKLNWERGYLVATNDIGKAKLEKLLGKWSFELMKITESPRRKESD